MKDAVVFFIFLVLLTCPAEDGLPSRMYIWNVGQGQWLTWVRPSDCVHFDMGGEVAPLKRIRELCHRKKNYVYLTHADMDHIKFLTWGLNNLFDLCLMTLPREHLSSRKARLIEGVPRCHGVHSIQILSHEIIDLTEQKKFFNSKTKSKNRSNIQQTTYPRISIPTVPDANLLSHVFVAKSPFGGILVSGDSPQRAEKIWAFDLPLGIDKYILGHHGSRTSTSDYLLQHLPQLKFAISSARKKRYGHPHIEVIRKLLEQNIPLLQTEKWGNFSFYL